MVCCGVNPALTAHSCFFTGRSARLRLRHIFRPLLRSEQFSRRLFRTACSSQPESRSSDSSNKFFLTTPLYYVNAAPHMGSAYTTIAADAIARYHRLRQKQVTFVTGTDEHGEKIAESARAKGVEPQQHCDGIVDSFKALWEQLDIQYDVFIRTTEEKHQAVVNEILQRVDQQGDIYRANYEGWYCVGCEQYKDDGEMEANHVCPLHKAPCVQRKEDNFFFRLSRYQQQIQDLIEKNPSFVQPASRRNEVLGWVRDGLRDFSISRAAVAWGFPMPQDSAQTVYVWFDALLGYASALLPPGEAASSENLQKRGWPANVHLVGKDILRFHAVYWPGMLMSAGLPLPEKIFAHGFLTKDGMKMGKSLGNILEPGPLVAAYGHDAVRFFFLKEVIFGQDGDFQEERFRNIVNAYLANTLGNLVNRCLGLLKKNCDSTFPADAASLDASHPLRLAAAAEVAKVAAAYEACALHEAADGAMAVAVRANKFVDESAPWTSFKKGSQEDKETAAQVLLAALEAARIASVMLSPITPATSGRISAQLGFSDEDPACNTWEGTAWGGIRKGQQVPAPQPVFARIECDFVTAPAGKAAAKQAAVPA
ncbi:hypothetical protein WJX84_009314 [Apatococcus fuscideae]|uniref:methionine--tRNA ligase n=1 Tax=Apatococcus fuscideae TaxID=2026836 RepID=A0AAW1SSH1_9CHLO